MLMKILRFIPILRDLQDTTLEDHKESCKELFATLFVSTMPIWLGAFIIKLTVAFEVDTNYFGAIRTLISNGELFLYASSLLAPVLYIALKERGEGRVFPAKLAHIIVLFLTVALTSAVFTAQRTADSINKEFLYNVSIYVYVIAIVMMYIAIVLNNNLLPNPADRMKSDENDYVKALKERRK